MEVNNDVESILDEVLEQVIPEPVQEEITEEPIQEEVKEELKELKGEPESPEDSLETIEKLSEVIHMEAYKKDMLNAKEELSKTCDDFKKSIKGDSDTTDRWYASLDKEFAKFKTLQQFETRLLDDKYVDNLFTDPDTHEPIELSIDSDPDRLQDFKKGFLKYMYQSYETFANIDAEFEALDKYTKELNADIEDAVYVLSDKVLSYLDMMTDKANAIEDEKTKKAMLKSIKYIKSGYDMSIYSEVLDKYPSVRRRCVEELEQPVRVGDIGKRYMTKVDTSKVKTSLIEFASEVDNGRNSFEERMLIRGDQYIVPDLFIYSLIRFYAMADWSDKDIKKSHASILLVISKLYRNEFEEDVKNNIINAIVEYLAKFEIK